MNSVWFNDKRVIPSKVMCVGRNYAKHIAELNNEMPEQMVLFTKTNAAVSHQLSSYHQEPLHYEGEICFLVEAGEFVGVGFGLDLTKRQLQVYLKSKNLPWERAKSFRGAGVFDRFVPVPVLGDTSRNDFSALTLELMIDGQQVQSGGVNDMLFKPQDILAELKAFTTLEDGDIVMTGTPEGVGEVKPGAEFIGRIYHGESLLVESMWTASLR